MASVTQHVALDGRSPYKVRVRIKGQQTVTRTFTSEDEARGWGTSTSP